MKKVIIFACAIMCMFSCVSHEMQEKKTACQELCDSLTEATELKVLTVESCRDTTWRVRKYRTVIVGKTPVHQPYVKTVKGCVLVMENGQQCLTTDFLHVPVGATIVQQTIYAPEKFQEGEDVGYRPVVQKYVNHVVANGEEYPIEFDIL